MILEKTLKDKIFNSLTSQQQEFLQQQVKERKTYRQYFSKG